MAISEWADLMPHTITYYPLASHNEYGAATYGAAVSYQARVTYQTRRTSSRITGQDTLASGQVWINGVISGVKLDDKIVLPDGSTPIIINWETVPDADGDHHTKLYFGAAGGG